MEQIRKIANRLYELYQEKAIRAGWVKIEIEKIKKEKEWAAASKTLTIKMLGNQE